MNHCRRAVAQPFLNQDEIQLRVSLTPQTPSSLVLHAIDLLPFHRRYQLETALTVDSLVSFYK